MTVRLNNPLPYALPLSGLPQGPDFILNPTIKQLVSFPVANKQTVKDKHSAQGVLTPTNNVGDLLVDINGTRYKLVTTWTNQTLTVSRTEWVFFTEYCDYILIKYVPTWGPVSVSWKVPDSGDWTVMSPDITYSVFLRTDELWIYVSGERDASLWLSQLVRIK